MTSGTWTCWEIVFGHHVDDVAVQRLLTFSAIVYQPAAGQR
jgi:hypothetical protein